MTYSSRRPHPRVLEYITPTQVIDGTECLWRLGFRADPSTSSLDRSGPAAALGSASHEVMSRLGDPLGFDAVWREAISRAADDLNSQWSPAVTPSPENWPGWSLTKVRMRRLWERNTRSVKRVTHETHPVKSGLREPPPLPWREYWIRHRTLPLAGRPDLVERIEEILVVIDLKTGLRQADATASQRTQLLLYCELIRSEIGECPAQASVESTRGELFSFAVDDQQIEEVVDRALTTFNSLNTATEQGLNESFATPSEAACGWCPFRPICGPFFNAYDQSWPIAHALLFRIRSVRQGVHGYEVEADVVQPQWRAGEAIHIVGLPFPSPPSDGDVWGAVDFAGRANSAVSAWNTRVAKWN